MGCANTKHAAEEPTFHSVRTDGTGGGAPKQQGSKETVLSLKPEPSSGSTERASDERKRSDPMAEISNQSPTPRLHKMTSDVHGSDLTEELRNMKLRDVSDEVLLAEVDLRNIQMHGRVSTELVELKYTFGKLLGQGSSTPPSLRAARGAAAAGRAGRAGSRSR